MFQSSPASKGGCYGGHPGVYNQGNHTFQSSPASKGGCYHTENDPFAGFFEVSILTRLERRMLPRGRCDKMRQNATFQSSPASKGGCYNLFWNHPDIWGKGFQSSPASKGGCYQLCLFLRQSQPESFNPHPPRKADATPAPHTQRNHHSHVSILTRLERRMLLSRRYGYLIPCPFYVSILTRLERRMLPKSCAASIAAYSVFQSSPASKGGCYARRWYAENH